MAYDYEMAISRTTIDKLGIRLYDNASDVVAEIVSNSYDADANDVKVTLPLNVFLVERGEGGGDKGYEIIVEDDGHGMTQDEVNEFFLKIGTDRRHDDKRKSDPVKKDWRSFSPKGRPVMGRKGIGKLAPFGICKRIEVWSAGGPKTAKGYQIAHLLLDYDKINVQTDKPYRPENGDQDGKYSHRHGTRIKLTNFLHRRIPDAETFMRQLSRKFGLGTTSFKVTVYDSIAKQTHSLSPMNLDILPSTKISVDDRPVNLDGKELFVTGWIAYSKTPYRNEEMAGVRIYARKKLAAVTRDFGQKAGFTGEHTIRSYLIGTITADWLDEDEDEDLIASDRQDILWASEKGTAFKTWGQELLKELGRVSVGPLNQKTYDTFMEKSDLEKIAKKRFGDTKVFDTAMTVGKTLGKMASIQNLDDGEYVGGLRELILTLAPHKMIVDKLIEIGTLNHPSPLEVVVSLFTDTRLAEAASMGQVAMERIGAIDSLESAIHAAPEPLESALQKILEESPWIIEPQWTVIQANQTFENLRTELENWYKKETGDAIQTKHDPDNTTKRADFVMVHFGRTIEIVEIKKPGHTLATPELERLLLYIRKMQKFLRENASFQSFFDRVHATLICDRMSVSDTAQEAFDGLHAKGTLDKKTWKELLLDTKEAHKDFLAARDKMVKASMKKK